MLKTILFIAGAALVNILVTLVFFSALLLLYVLILIPRIPAESVFLGFPPLFAVAFVLSAILYRKARFFKKFTTEGTKLHG
jgi:cytochrome c biogenesis protein CcdA